MKNETGRCYECNKVELPEDKLFCDPCGEAIDIRSDAYFAQAAIDEEARLAAIRLVSDAEILATFKILNNRIATVKWYRLTTNNNLRDSADHVFRVIGR